MLERRNLHNGGVNLHNNWMLLLAKLVSGCNICIPWPWKHRFCHLIGEIRPCFHWVILEKRILHNGELICIIYGFCRWQNRFLIAFVAFLDPENIGFVTFFVRFGHDFSEFYSKIEFCIMAELICILCKLPKGARVASRGFLI